MNSALCSDETNPAHECGKRNCSVDVPTVSIIKLIASPGSFHDKRIRVQGYISLDVEGSAVYLSREDFTYGFSQNAVWLNLDNWGEGQAHCHLSYCLIEGTFNSKQSGHWSRYSGSIGDIYRMEKILSRADIEQIKVRANDPTANK